VAFASVYVKIKFYWHMWSGLRQCVTMSAYNDSSDTEVEVESDSSASYATTDEEYMSGDGGDDEDYMSGDGGDDYDGSRLTNSYDSYCLFLQKRQGNGYVFVGFVTPTKTAIEALFKNYTSRRQWGSTLFYRVDSLVSLDPNDIMPNYEWTATADNDEQFTGVIIPKSRVVTDVAKRVLLDDNNIDKWHADATMAVTDPMAYVAPELRGPLDNLLKTSRLANKLFTPNYCLFLDADPNRNDTYQYIFKGFAWTNIKSIKDNIKSDISRDIQSVQLFDAGGRNWFAVGHETLRWKAWIDPDPKSDSQPDFVGWLFLKETVVQAIVEGVALGNNNVFDIYPWFTTAVLQIPNPIAYVSDRDQEWVRFLAQTNHTVGVMFQLRGSGEDTAQGFSDNLLNS
jgi:hypothetical protein